MANRILKQEISEIDFSKIFIQVVIDKKSDFGRATCNTSAKYCVTQSLTTKIPLGIQIGWDAEQVSALYASYFAGTSGIFLFLLHSVYEANIRIFRIRLCT